MNEQDCVTIPKSLLADLIQVCQWHQSMVNGMRVGETMENHPDWNAVEYLENESRAIEQFAIAYLPDYATVTN